MIRITEPVAGTYLIETERVTKETHQMMIKDDAVGIFNTGSGHFITSFGLVPFSEWRDVNNNPYASLDQLVNDLNTFFFEIASVSQVKSLMFNETFVGDGLTNTFQLDGNIQNGTFTQGSWAVARVQNLIRAEVVRDDNLKPTYETPFFTGRISVASISASGLVTLTGTVRSGITIRVRYWYALGEADVIDDYFFDDIVSSSEADDQVLATEAALQQEITDREAGDEGTVTIHNDVSDAGSGQIITAQERIDINASIGVHSDVDLSGVTLFDDDVLNWDSGRNAFVPSIHRVFRRPELIINNTNTPIDVLNVAVDVQVLVPHKITISYDWSLNDATQDFITIASFGGQDLMTALTDNSIIHEQEPKDTAGGDPDGRGTNQRHGFTRVFFVTPTALGNNQFILQVAGTANGDLASIWDTSVEIQQTRGVVTIT